MLELALPLLFTIVTTAMFVRSVWLLVSAVESRSWPSVPGVIVDAALAEQPQGDGRTFHAKVSYRFSVGDQELVGHRIAFGDSAGAAFRATAARTVKRFRAGTTVTVHYDPAKPQDAVIETGVSTQLLWMLVLTAGFLAASLWALA